MSSICHLCGRRMRHEQWYFGKIHYWTRDWIEDRAGTGAEFERLIGQPCNHDWHKAGFTTRNGGDGIAGDGDDLVPGLALDWLRKHESVIPKDERLGMFKRAVAATKDYRDIEVKLEGELKAYRQR